MERDEDMSSADEMTTIAGLLVAEVSRKVTTREEWDKLVKTIANALVSNHPESAGSVMALRALCR
jgi:hypothetical protein